MQVGNDTQGAPRRRRWPRVAGWTLAVLAVAAGALIHWRIPAAETALRAGLAAMGFGKAIVAVDALSLRRIRVARLTLGRELDIAGLTVDLSPDRIRTRPVSAIGIRTLAVDLTRPDGPLRRLLAGRAEDRRSAGTPLSPAALLARRGALPDLAIDRWTLRLPLNAGVLDLAGDALVRDDGQDGLTATAALRGTVQAAGTSLDLDARGIFDLDDDGAVLTLNAAAPKSGATLDLGLTLAGLRATPTARGEATLRIAELARLSPLLPQLARIGGALSVAARTTAPLPVQLDAPPDTAALLALLRTQGGFAATLTADALRLPSLPPVDASAQALLGPDKAHLSIIAGAPALAANAAAALAISDPHGTPKAGLHATARLADLSRLAGVVPALAGFEGALRLRARTATPVALPPSLPTDAATFAPVLCGENRGVLEVTADGLRRRGLIEALAGTVTAAASCAAIGNAEAEIGVNLSAARVTAGNLSASRTRVTGPLLARWHGDALTVEIPAPLALSAESITAPIATTGPLRAAITAAKQPALRLATDDLRPASARIDLAAALETLTVTVPTEAGTPVRIRLAPAKLAAAGGPADTLDLRLDAARADVTRGDLALGLSGITARGTRPDGVAAIALKTAARLETALAGKKLMAPLDFKLGGRLLNTTLSFDATAAGPGQLSLSAKGRHDIAAGKGAADLALARLRFGSGGARLADLLPGRKAYEPRSGALDATARIAWDGGMFDGSADVTVADMTIANPDGTVSIEGLATKLRFERLWPPVTAPGQEITARRVAAGATLDDLALRFALRPGRLPAQPVVAIDALRAGFAGGRITGRDILYDPAQTSNRALIRLDGIDLEKLLDVARVEGLSGTGLISGTIPIRMEGGAVAIDKGALAAARPGIVRFKSDAARKALESGGKYVTLALQALEDFRYHRLTFEIDKAPAGEGSVLMRIEGHNPAVMNAQPFAINLNVSGNVDRLAGILARLTLLPEEIVRSIVPRK